MVDDIELARLFVEYARLKKQLEEVKEMIEAGVLERMESVKIAGVTAMYYKPSRETPNYEEAAVGFIGVHPEYKTYLPMYQSAVITTRWKEFCEKHGIDVPQGAEKPARVVIK